MTRRSYSWNAYESDLAAGVDASSGTLLVTSAAGLTAPVYLVLEPENPSLREYVKVTAISTNTLTVERGLDGSANAGQAHAAGVKIRAVAVHQWLNDIFDDIIDVDTRITDHEGAGDPHPQYLTTGEGDAAYVNVSGDTMAGPLLLPGDPVTDPEAARKKYVDDQDLASVGGHEGDATDPHAAAGYLKEADADLLYLRLDVANDPLGAELDMGLNKVVNVADPTADEDAATKKYVDDQDAAGEAYADNAVSTHNGAAGAHGGKSDGNPLNHDRYTDAEAIAAVGSNVGGVLGVSTGGVFTATPSGPGQQAFAEVWSGSVARPAGWSKTLVVVRAYVQYAGATGGVQLAGRFKIDGVAGPQSSSFATDAGGDPSVTVVQARETTDATINFAVELQNTLAGGETATARTMTIDYTLHRTG